MFRRAGGILHVHQRNASGPACEIRQRIVSRLCDPVQIDLELHEFRIGILEQHIVRDLPFHPREFEIVIVIGELDAGVARLGADAVEIGGDLLPAIQRPAAFFGDPRYHDVLMADRLCGIERSAPGIGLDRSDVNGGRRESMSIEDCAHVRRAVAEVPGELDLLVTGLCHASNCPFEVLLQHGTHRVELNPDLVQSSSAGCGPRGPGTGERQTDSRHGLNKRPSCSPAPRATLSPLVAHSSLRFIASTAYAAARAVSAM
jgi:hypothetical protein